MDARNWLESVLAGHDLDEAAAHACMGCVLDGEMAPEWLAGFLVALRAKGESDGEVAGFVRAMREHATPIPSAHDDLVDTCGTGGDGADTFNVSTTAAFVVAGAGGRVAKHGNRSVSSRCGSADVLEALGARLDLSAAAVGRCVDEIGFGFLFAPALHGAMRHAVGVRRALGVRTVFNVLGPLTNPAGARHQVLGVYEDRWLEGLARVLHRLGQHQSLVVRGRDGLDELSVCAKSDAVHVSDPDRRIEIDPAKLGLGPHDPASLRGGDAAENARILRGVLEGQTGPRRDIVVLNAGAALWTAGVASSLEEGVARAAAGIDDGQALAVLEAYLRATREWGGPDA